MGLHVSTPELIWSLVALAGVVLRMLALHESLADLRASHAGDHALQIVAGGRVREDVSGAVVKLAFLGVGVYAMTQPDPPNPPTGELILTAVFIAAILVMTVNSLLDARERAELSAYLRRPEVEAE